MKGLELTPSGGEAGIYFKKNNLTILKEISISHVLGDSSYYLRSSKLSSWSSKYDYFGC